jgi:hypothetical protein
MQINYLYLHVDSSRVQPKCFHASCAAHHSRDREDTHGLFGRRIKLVVTCAGQSGQVIQGVLLEVHVLAPGPGMAHGLGMPAGIRQLGHVFHLNISLDVQLGVGRRLSKPKTECC